MTGLNLTPWRKHNRPLSSPSSLFENLHQEVDRIFEDFSNGSSWPRLAQFSQAEDLMPAIDLSETEKFVEVFVDLPGVEDDNIDVSLSDNVLTIKATRESETENKEKDFHQVERSYGSYFRQVAMPCQVLEDDIQATFKKGVLKIVLAKAPEARTSHKKIEIRSS